MSVYADKLSYRVDLVIGHQGSGNYGDGIEDGCTKEESIDQDIPYVLEVTEVNEEGGQEQPGAENKPEVGNVNQGKQQRSDGQMRD